MVFRRALIPLGLVLLVGGLAVAGLSVPERPSDGPSAALPAIDPGAGPAGQNLARLQQAARADPEDWRAWAALGSAYVEEARATGASSWYPSAEAAFDRSLALNPARNADASAGMGALAAARHDFALALEWGEKARDIAPDDPLVYGAVGDALVELGRYPEAFGAFQRMVDLRPGLASYARVSYARELQGDVAGAIVAMEAAADAASDKRGKAFATFQLGELYWNSGRAEEAVRHYERANALDPGFVPPRARLARARFYEGRVEEAVDRYEEVLQRLPLPEYVIDLADIYRVSRQPALAEEQVALLEAQRRLLASDGVATDLEFALFSADHRIDLEAGLAAARAQWERRKSVFVADVLAWQLYAHGRHEEALAMSDQALRLGTRNALFHFHRSMIEGALGRTEAARADLEQAMTINPRFSILHTAGDSK